MKLNENIPLTDKQLLMMEIYSAIENAVLLPEKSADKLELKYGHDLYLNFFTLFLKEVCQRVSAEYACETLFTEQELNRAIQVFINQSRGETLEGGFYLLIPMQAQPRDLERKPELTLAYVDLNCEDILSGEAAATRLLDVIPSHFIKQALDLSTSEHRLGFKDNLRFQLNYYRRLFGLEPLSF